MDRKLTQKWQPQSWQTHSADQQPLYKDAAAVEQVLAEIHWRPSLVTWGEVDKLRRQLAEAGRGERFVLQGGDCAESFDDCTAEPIANKLKILMQMSLVLVHGLKKRVIRIGRIAGQYAKPRSVEYETRNGVTLPSYRGDIINRSGFSAAERAADPSLMLRGYEHAAFTLNYLRALVDGGFADLHHSEYWDLDFVRNSPLEAEYRRIAQSILNSLNIMEGLAGRSLSDSERIDVFTSHEGLHLLYEQAQTTFVAEAGRWYNLSTHFPWIGVRTTDVNGAHTEYFRGIANPIAIKVGTSMSAEQLLELCSILNPDNELGRLTLIHRFGAAHINDKLPALVEAVRQDKRQVLWICDPMHGNTETTASGLKTRRFENILEELEAAFALHEQLGSILAGVHFEFTGDDVTECTGGIRGLTDTDLERAYKSQVDPRLNYEQALEMAMRIVARKTSKRLFIN